MCAEIETKLKIIELSISALIPIAIFVFGIILTRRLENIKNQSAKDFHWQSRWGEIFFEKYKEFIEHASELLSVMQLLLILEKEGKSNTPEGLARQDEVNNLITRLFKEGNQLKIQAISSFGESSDITMKIDNLYSLFANTLLTRSGNFNLIFTEITQLNTTTGQKFDLSIEKKKHIRTTSHIPNGGFTALCKAFRPLKRLLGLQVESPAIRH